MSVTEESKQNPGQTDEDLIKTLPPDLQEAIANMIVKNV